MDIFNNTETKVESFSVIKSNNVSFHSVSESAVGNSALRDIARKEANEKFDQELQNIEKEAHMKSLREQVVKKTLYEGQIEHKIGQLSNVGKNKIFKDIVFEVFYNSLLMDKPFLEENANTLYQLVDTYIEDNGGYSLLEKAIETSNSVFLKRLKTSCDSIVREVCSRKIKECNELKDAEHIDFDMNDSEKELFDNMKDNLDIERISELVKNKVLTVVKDEKARQENEAKLAQDIEDDLIDNKEVTDESSLNAALESIVISGPKCEDSTLFNALFRDSYYEYIRENVSIRSTDEHNIDEHKENAKNYNTEISPEDIDDTADDDDPITEDELNMDIVLVEAITKYTLMETLYTLQLENYTRPNIQKLIHKMLNIK